MALDDEPNELAVKLGAMTNSHDEADFIVPDEEMDNGESEMDDNEPSAEESGAEESNTEKDNEDLPADDEVDDGYTAQSEAFDIIATSISQLAALTTPLTSTPPTNAPSTSSSSLDAVMSRKPEPAPMAVDDVSGNRMGTRKRGIRAVQRTFECVCGEEVAEEDRDDCNNVVKCQGQGCETIWVRYCHYLLI